MAIAFADVCGLLESLEALETAQPPLLLADKRDRVKNTIEAWFKARRHRIDELDEHAAVGLLSALLPERRPDRVYGLQAPSLSRVVSRALGLGAAQSKDLQAYRQSGRGDLGECVRRLLERGGPPALPKVLLAEVDELLDWLAGHSRFSSSTLQDATVPSSSGQREARLGAIMKRLPPQDAKWLVRLMLKDFGATIVDDALVLKNFHFLLPDLLRFQHDLAAAASLLRSQLKMYPSNPDPRSRRLLMLNASSSLAPAINTKVSRPDFTKARSIDHCLNMLGKHSWVIERKYDGEYAEIHIDLTRSADPAKCIKIFAKSGKDATQDRAGLHATLVKCLRLGRADCRIKRQAILLGEMVVWSDATRAVMPFEEVRKHVTRSGVPLGTAADSKPAPHEHLCIVFFDLLLLDDNITMAQPIDKRRALLKSVYDKIPGRAKAAEWKVIDFAHDVSRRRLMEQFAASNAQRCEGLVFKPCGLPYYCIERDPSRSFHGYIKLKKDYIAGLGDEADLAVVGASYNAQEASKSKLENIRWTTFYLGALINRPEALRFDCRPGYRFLGTITHQHCIPPAILKTIHELAPFNIAANKTELEYDILGAESLTFTFFKEPLVFEVLGSGYVKPSDCDFYMLRHARVTKLHQDRTWKDCVDFNELQQLAAEARTIGTSSESQENRQHLARLENTMKKRLERQGTLTPSPKKKHIPILGSAGMGSDLPTSPFERQPLGAISINTQSPVRTSPKTPARKRRRLVDSPPRLANVEPKQIMYNPPNGQKHQIKCQGRCSKPCILADTVIYLAPCISKSPYITIDLLGEHDAVRVSAWQHWIRKEHENIEDCAVVDESQAFEGLKRIILVERHREAATMQIINEYIRASDCGSTPIEVWDWRMLESLRGHSGIGALPLQHLLGKITTDCLGSIMTYRPALT